MLAIAVGHLSQSIDVDAAPHPRYRPTFLRSIELVDVNTGMAAGDTGRRPQVGPASVTRRHAPLPVSPCRPRRRKGLEVPHIRDRHRGVMKTAEDAISLVENIFGSQEAPYRRDAPSRQNSGKSRRCDEGVA